MSYEDASFLDTKQEHDRWHHGLYKGFKIHNPQKIATSIKAGQMSFKNWYKKDYHYHDFMLLTGYFIKAAGIFGGTYLLGQVLGPGFLGF